MNVLLVDDNADDRAILRFLFQAHGCLVHEADNGGSGLIQALDRQPDLIISDALMPEMDGFQFLRRAKADSRLKDIPFIFYSAVYTGRNEEKLALSLGAEAFLVKPLEPELLWQEIQRLLAPTDKARKPAAPAGCDHDFLDEYSHIVVMKLEEKVHELENAQAELCKKQQQLEELNRSLEERIDVKVGELRRMDQLLIQQVRFSAMGEMLNNIAHQWRQPLNNVGLMVQNLRLDVADGAFTPTQLDGQTDKIMNVLTDLSKTIDNFRTFFHKETEQREFLVSQAVAQVMGIMGASLSGSGIRTELMMEDEVTAYGSLEEFSQALLNIVNNARDVLVERMVGEPQILLKVFEREGMSVVTVSDNGGGMDPEVLEKMFDPYYTTKFQSPGKGMCMYMSKVIIEKKMGGRLSASNQAEGAQLRIEVRPKK